MYGILSLSYLSTGWWQGFGDQKDASRNLDNDPQDNGKEGDALSISHVAARGLLKRVMAWK
jgi:hypothetical protein